MISIFCSLPVPEVLGRDVHDAVGVDVEADLDLRDAPRRRRDAGELELAERLVVGGHLALALEHVDLHARLVVLGRREDLRLAGRDRRVAVDQLGPHAALGLDAEGQRGHVEQQHVLDVAGQHARLDRGAHGHDLVRVHAAVRVLAGQLLDLLLHGRHARHAAHEDDVLDAVLADARVLDRLLGRGDHAVEQVGRQLVQLRAGEPLVQVLRHGLDGGDEGQVDLRLLRRAELGLGLLGLLVEALEGHLVLRQVDALGLLELAHEEVHDRLVEVVAAEVVVARGGLDLEHAVADLEHGHVEGAAAEVEHEDRLVGLLLVEPVGERRRRGLVDDALDVEARDLAGVLGRLALVVVEVRRDGDHRGVDAVAQVGLRVGLQLLEDHRADLGRGELLAARLHARVAVRAGDDLERDDLLLLLDLGLLAAHEALDREDRVLGVGHCLPLGRSAHEALAALRERDHRGGRPRALGVLDHGGLAALEDGHARVGRAEIDADRLAHVLPAPLLRGESERNLSDDYGRCSAAAPRGGVRPLLSCRPCTALSCVPSRCSVC